jgi:REP element-mobilizing transposase RayT
MKGALACSLLLLLLSRGPSHIWSKTQMHSHSRFDKGAIEISFAVTLRTPSDSIWAERLVSGHASGVPQPSIEKDTALAAEMAIPIRHSDSAHVIAGARTFFVTSSIAGKRHLLQSGRSAGLFVRVLYDYREQSKFRLHEFVVMPDHFHLLLTVESTVTIERAVQFVKGGFAFRAGRELGFRAPVWQKGF